MRSAIGDRRSAIRDGAISGLVVIPAVANGVNPAAAASAASRRSNPALSSSRIVLSRGLAETSRAGNRNHRKGTYPPPCVASQCKRAVLTKIYDVNVATNPAAAPESQPCTSIAFA
jgi:hypothetical protein